MFNNDKTVSFCQHINGRIQNRYSSDHCLVAEVYDVIPNSGEQTVSSKVENDRIEEFISF